MEKSPLISAVPILMKRATTLKKVIIVATLLTALTASATAGARTTDPTPSMEVININFDTSLAIVPAGAPPSRGIEELKKIVPRRNPIFAGGVLPNGRPVPGYGYSPLSAELQPSYAPVSDSGNKSNCDSFGYTGREGIASTTMLYQSVEVLGGAYTLTNNNEHRAGALAMDNTPHHGNGVQVGLQKSSALGWNDTTAFNQVTIYYEFQQSGDAFSYTSPTYRWVPVMTVPEWSNHVVAVERYSASQPWTVRVLVDGTDRSGWISMLEWAPNRITAFDESYNNAGYCDNAYHAFGNAYWDFPYQLPVSPGMAYGHINNWNFRGTLRAAAAPYCGGLTAPDGITWTCNPDNNS